MKNGDRDLNGACISTLAGAEWNTRPRRQAPYSLLSLQPYLPKVVPPFGLYHFASLLFASFAL